MAHTLDTSSRFTGSGAPQTASYTCGAGTTVLVLGIIVGGSAARAGGAPTYNGIAMTQAGTTRQAAAAPETNVELWYLLNPPTGAALTISIPNTGTARNLFCRAGSFKAAAGKTSTLDNTGGNTGTSTNPASSTTITAGSLVVGVIGSGAQTWNPTAQTGTDFGGADADDGAFGDGGQYVLSGSNPQALNYTFGTSEDWAICTAAFKEVDNVTGSGTPVLPKFAASGSGTEIFTGSGAPALMALAASGAGIESITGSGAPALKALAASGAGNVVINSLNGVVVTDNFNRASLGSDWTTVSGAFSIAGNKVTETSSSQPAVLYRNDIAPAANQYAQLDGIVTLAGGRTFGPAVRIQVGSNGGYFAYLAGGTPFSQEDRIYRINGDNSLTLIDTVGTNFTDTDVMKIDAVDDTITVYKNGAVYLQGTDSTYSSGRVGIATFNSASGMSADNFEGGDLAGAAPVALKMFTVSGAGDVVTGVSGSAAVTLPKLAASGAGTVLFTGSGSAALKALAATGAGTEQITGSGAPALKAFAVSASGTERFAGSGASALKALAAAGAGTETIAGSGTAALKALAVSSAGTERFTGSGTAALKALAASGAGAQTVPGAGSPTLKAFAASGAGTERITGSGTAALRMFTVFGSSQDTVSGSGAATLRGFAASGTGQQTVAGAGAVALPKLGAAGAGQQIVQGAGASALPRLAAAGAGTLLVTGSGAATLRMFTVQSSLLAAGVEIQSLFAVQPFGVDLHVFNQPVVEADAVPALQITLHVMQALNIKLEVGQ